MAAPNVAATLRVLQALQARGLAWMATVTSRDEVSRAMARYMDALGVAPAALPPVLHIAGTKGKGSTAALAEAMLRAGGLRTGLFTSPHLVSPTERFRVDGAPVSDADYCAAFWRAWRDVGGAGGGDAPGAPGAPGAPPAAPPDAPPTTLPDALPGFNFLTLLAFRVFIAARVDVMVLEVGVGGLLDATNVLPASRVLASAVTQLDFDHTEILGPTIALIAAQKAGIFKGSVPAVVARGADARADAVFDAAAAAAGTHAWRAPRAARALGDAPLALRGRFQRANAALAVALVDAALARAAAGEVAWPNWSERGAAAAAAAAAAAGIDGGALARARAAHARGVAGAAAGAAGAAAADSDSDGGARVPTLPALRGALPAFYAAGLARAAWPGRAQVVPLRAARGAPAARALLDGAHTALSMGEVARWFAEEEAGAGAGAPPAALVFYCGSDKDALSLLLPLASLPWRSVAVVAPAWALTPRAPPPAGLRAALRAAHARAAAAGDESAARDVAAAADALGARGGEGGDDGGGAGGAGGGAAGGGAPPPWPATLARLWDEVATAPELAALREKAAAARGAAPGAAPPPAPPRAAVCAAGVAAAGAAARAAGAPRILITGSLYLGGDALAALGAGEAGAGEGA
jgi:folylpolyglutamate synthase/dihydrofolate synthase